MYILIITQILYCHKNPAQIAYSVQVEMSKHQVIRMDGVNQTTQNTFQ